MKKNEQCIFKHTTYTVDDSNTRRGEKSRKIFKETS